MKNLYELDPKVKRRRDLLPWWIKAFCWLFMVAMVLVFVRLILLLLGINTEFEFYGINAKDNYPINVIIVFIVFFLHGITAFSLWFEKKYAVDIAIWDAIIGILLCVLVMGIGLYDGNYLFRLEIILLFLFLTRLVKIKKKWGTYIYRKLFI